jgi:hypothetical protein
MLRKKEDMTEQRFLTINSNAVSLRKKEDIAGLSNTGFHFRNQQC